MTITEETDVARMARRIADVTRRDGWKTDKSIALDMQKMLGQLTTLKVDKDLLQRTQIGAAVNKLKKHDDDVVRGYSASLTKKWKTEVGIPATRRPLEHSKGPRPAPALKQDAGQQKLEHARKKLQEGYASEKAKRESRTVQVLNGPIAKGRRGTKVSTASSRSSVGRAQLAQYRGLASASHRAASAPPGGCRVLATVQTQGQTRRPATGFVNISAEERHRQRQLKYRALSGQRGPASDCREPERAQSTCKGVRIEGRPRSGLRPSSVASSIEGSAPLNFETTVNPRKAMLDKMYPRVCGVGNASSSNASASGAKKSRSSTAVKRKKINYTEGQREVLSWLKGLSVDMSEYAPAFFENGFDSVKLLSTIEKSDLPSLVPKKGHHRLIQQALDELRHQHSTSAALHRRDHFQKESRKRRKDPFEDEDSDDSFVVSDDGEYRPGHITAMFRKNRKRRYSIDSDDSINMEASFDEIQKEEKRSALYGEYEDFREDMRNKKMLKKKK